MPVPKPERLPIRIVEGGESYKITLGDERATLYLYCEDEPTRAKVTNRLSSSEAKALAQDVARTLQAAWRPTHEDLLFTVEEWALDNSKRVEILARVHLMNVAYATFAATVAERPKSRLVLRKQALELEVHVPRESA